MQFVAIYVFLCVCFVFVYNIDSEIKAIKSSHITLSTRGIWCGSVATKEYQSSD